MIPDGLGVLPHTHLIYVLLDKISSWLERKGHKLWLAAVISLSLRQDVDILSVAVLLCVFSDMLSRLCSLRFQLYSCITAVNKYIHFPFLIEPQRLLLGCVCVCLCVCVCVCVLVRPTYLTESESQDSLRLVSNRSSWEWKRCSLQPQRSTAWDTE